MKRAARVLASVLPFALLVALPWGNPARGQAPSTVANDRVASLLEQLSTDLKALSAVVVDAAVKEHLKKLDASLTELGRLFVRLQRRFEYYPGSTNPDDRILIWGPFQPGHSYLMIRQGLNVAERYTVEEIYGNGWLKVKTAAKDMPLAGRDGLFLNAGSVIAAARDD